MSDQLRKCGHPLGSTSWCPDCVLAEARRSGEFRPQFAAPGDGQGGIGCTPGPWTVSADGRDVITNYRDLLGNMTPDNWTRGGYAKVIARLDVTAWRDAGQRMADAERIATLAAPGAAIAAREQPNAVTEEQLIKAAFFAVAEKSVQLVSQIGTWGPDNILTEAGKELLRRLNEVLQASPAASPSAGQEREAFEAWAEDQGFLLTRTVHGDDYQDLRTQGPWDAWQARAALTSASEQEGGEPVAYLVTNLPSGEPSLCFKDEMGDYGDEDHIPVFTPLGALSAPQPPLAGAGEVSHADAAAFVERTVGTWREYDHDDVIAVVKAALNPKPAPLNGGCGDGESE